jgi:type IV pilus biogenesis protein PilP
MLERYYKKNYVIAFIAITAVVLSSFAVSEGLNAAPLSFSSIQKSAAERNKPKAKVIKPFPPKPAEAEDDATQNITPTDKNKEADTAETKEEGTKDVLPLMPNKAIDEKDKDETSNNDKNEEDNIAKSDFSLGAKSASSPIDENKKSNKIKPVKPATIDRLTPSQQLLKESNKMFNTMADIEQKNALLQLELDHQKLLTEILNVKIAKEKIEEEEAERKRKASLNQNNTANTTPNMIFTQTVTPTKPEPKAFSITNNNKNQTQPIQQNMYNGNSTLGTMRLPPTTTNNNNEQQGQVASTQPIPTPAIKKPEAPKKQTTYSVSFIEGVAGKLKGVLKTSGGQEISVKEGDDLSTGHTVVAIEMTKIILEKDGKKEVILVK